MLPSWISLNSTNTQPLSPLPPRAHMIHRPCAGCCITRPRDTQSSPRLACAPLTKHPPVQGNGSAAANLLLTNANKPPTPSFTNYGYSHIQSNPPHPNQSQPRIGAHGPLDSTSKEQQQAATNPAPNPDLESMQAHDLHPRPPAPICKSGSGSIAGPPGRGGTHTQQRARKKGGAIPSHKVGVRPISICLFARRPRTGPWQSLSVEEEDHVVCLLFPDACC